MNVHTSNFELTKNIEHYLRALSKVYEQDGERQFQEIIVNAHARIHEAWSGDNWTGSNGHALFLVLPQRLFLDGLKNKSGIQDQIKADLNRLHNIQNEFIAEIFLEMEVAEDNEWRQESGLLINNKRDASPDAIKRIWGATGFRLFLSHKSEVKKEVASIKDGLRLFGVSCFVAHQDIHPTKAWQDEIENALASMDGFVALMTENFHDSDWTDQEVGYAVARGVPIVAVRLGKDPYGFIGKFQALTSAWSTAVEDIVKILIKNDLMFSAYVQALRHCQSWDSGNVLAKVLPSIEKLSASQIDELVNTYNQTSELRGSFGFNGTKSRVFGRGLVSYLNRFGNRQFKYSETWLIEAA